MTCERNGRPIPYQTLCEVEVGVVALDEVAPQRIHNHEDNLVERWLSLHSDAALVPCRQSRQEGFVGKEASRKERDRSYEQCIGGNDGHQPRR
jgi:hypothetical protein